MKLNQKHAGVDKTLLRIITQVFNVKKWRELARNDGKWKTSFSLPDLPRSGQTYADVNESF